MARARDIFVSRKRQIIIRDLTASPKDILGTIGTLVSIVSLFVALPLAFLSLWPPRSLPSIARQTAPGWPISLKGRAAGPRTLGKTDLRFSRPVQWRSGPALFGAQRQYAAATSALMVLGRNCYVDGHSHLVLRAQSDHSSARLNTQGKPTPLHGE